MGEEQSARPTGWSGHAHFTIDDIAAMLPGPARLMHEVGQRWWKGYYAAKAGNWPLAQFEVKEVREVIEFCMITRPKYRQFMEPFLQEGLRAVEVAVQKRDWGEFEQGYRQAVKDANDYHKAADKPLIRWKLPDYPPPDFDLTPREES